MCDCKKNNCCSNTTPSKIETLTLDDGRRAERHTILDENGNEIVEIFAEEKRPLKLEKRITREMKNILSKEVHETIKDGEVAYQEVRALEVEAPLKILSRVGIADHHKIVDGDYVRKEEVGKMIENGVIAGMTALMDRMEPVKTDVAPPILRAQSVIEKNVEENKKSDMTVNIIMTIIVILQIGFFGYLYLM